MSRRAHDLDALTGDTPAALIAKDYHSLWLNSAGARARDGDLEVAGGVVERDERGEPTGVLREEAAWRFKERHLTSPTTSTSRRCAPACELAAARGVTAVHDKDGWLGALRLWQQLEEAGALTLRVWQSIPHDAARRTRARSGSAPASASPHAAGSAT